jgi:hypothetical protein
MGLEIVRFTIAKSELGAEDNAAEAFRRWTASPGLAFSARRSSLTAPPARNDESAALLRRDEIADILAIKPLAPDYWLSLARTLDTTKQPSAKVVEALTLSMLTGANEGYLEPQRGILGMSLWEQLPPEIRRRAATDLTSIPLNRREKLSLQRILLQKPADVRQEIRVALRTAGISARDLADVGL